MDYLEFTIPSGHVRIQPAGHPSTTGGGYKPAGVPGDLVKHTGRALKDALAAIAPAADAVLLAFIESVKSPKSISVELGMSFDAEGNVFLAKVHAEASLKVTCTWEK
jgi:hypothetical protein